MNSSVKKLTEASILTSLFIVITIIALSTGIAYGLYLDFGVPIIFALIYFRCDFKYTLLSGVSSIVIILLMLGNFASAIIISQSFLMGIVCAYLICKKSGIFDDLLLGSIAGVLFMVLIDILARNIIGYSFMEEVQGYIEFLGFIKSINFKVIYYLLIAMFPFGMIFSIYFFSLVLGKKLNILSENGTRKYYMIRSLKIIGSFMNLKKENFLLSISYILLFRIIQITDLEINNTYIKTISICIDYLCLYFVIRDCYTAIGNYINLKYKKKCFNYIYMFTSILLLAFFFEVTTIVFTGVFILMNKQMHIRERQNNVVLNNTNRLIETYK